MENSEDVLILAGSEADARVRDSIKVNGECLNNIRYAGDTVICTNNIVGLQYRTDRVVEVSEKYGSTLNIK